MSALWAGFAISWDRLPWSRSGSRSPAHPVAESLSCSHSMLLPACHGPSLSPATRGLPPRLTQLAACPPRRTQRVACPLQSDSPPCVACLLAARLALPVLASLPARPAAAARVQPRSPPRTACLHKERRLPPRRMPREACLPATRRLPPHYGVNVRVRPVGW